MTGIIAVPGAVTERDAALIKAVVGGIVPEIRDQLMAELTPIKAENEALRGELAEVRGLNDSLVERVAELEDRPVPEVDMDVVNTLLDGFAENMKTQIEETVSALPTPKDGKDADMDEVRGMVAEAVAQIPAPQDGKDCDMEAVTKQLAELVKQAVADIPAAKDGVGLADALIDSDGCLVITMTDGRTKSLGRVHGNDGEDGKTFTLDDFDIVPTDERTIEMSFQNGQVKHTFELEFPVPVYRDVWNEKAEYRRGDMVSWGGSVWHCDEPKGLKPDAPESGWTLAVKRGRDGKAK